MAVRRRTKGTPSLHARGYTPKRQPGGGGLAQVKRTNETEDGRCRRRKSRRGGAGGVAEGNRGRVAPVGARVAAGSDSRWGSSWLGPLVCRLRRLARALAL